MPQIFHAPQTEAPALLDEESLIQRYEALPPRAKTVLHLKVIAGPYIEKDVLSRAASMVQIPLPDGKNLNSGVIGEIVGREKKSGLWDQINDPGSLVRHHVNIAAFEDPQRDLYIKAIEAAERRDAYYYSGYSEAQSLRKLRFAIYKNDARATAELVAADPPRAWAKLAQFFGILVLEPEWLASRAPVIREAVLMAKLISFLFNGVPAADF